MMVGGCGPGAVLWVGSNTAPFIERQPRTVPTSAPVIPACRRDTVDPHQKTMMAQSFVAAFAKAAQVSDVPEEAIMSDTRKPSYMFLAAEWNRRLRRPASWPCEAQSAAAVELRLPTTATAGTGSGDSKPGANLESAIAQASLDGAALGWVCQSPDHQGVAYCEIAGRLMVMARSPKPPPAEPVEIQDEPGMEERFQRALRKALNTPPKHRTASKGRVHKGKNTKLGRHNC
jgi:hypothetical protein